MKAASVTERGFLSDMNKKEITFITLGCSKNVVDSEVAIEQFKLNKWDVNWENYNTPSENVIINTCGFIGDAKQESIDTILFFANLKNQKKIKRLFVVGCLVQRYKKELLTEIPEIDAVYGIEFLPQLINDIDLEYFPKHLQNRILTTPRHYSFLKIAEGCNRHCSFCAIPLIRGNHTSKKIETIVSEAEKLVALGVKEIILISQDLVFYGKDNYGDFKLTELVEKLAQINSLQWLRLHYLHPRYFSDNLLNVMERNQNICRYFDMPIQHISDTMLKTMRRGISKAETIAVLEKIRKILPDAAIRTTLLVGHPGEGRKEFNELYRFVRDFRFDRLGVFIYSHEENTPAYKMENIISKRTKQNRYDKLMNLQQQISLEKNREKIGSTIKVIIDRNEDKYFIARSQFDSPEIDNEILIPISENLIVGKFYDVAITEANEYDLIAKIDKK